jgi:hypothetical protein
LEPNHQIFGALFAVAIFLLVRKYGRFLRHTAAIAHAKIIISFIMVKGEREKEGGGR